MYDNHLLSVGTELCFGINIRLFECFGPPVHLCTMIKTLGAFICLFEKALQWLS